MNLADTREAVADALSTVPGYTVRPRPFPGAAKTGDGWVIVTAVQPGPSFTTHTASLTAVAVLSSDEVTAESNLDDDAIELLVALTEVDGLDLGDLALEAQVLATGTTATPLYVAALTMTVEVD